jgi:hypothetical protein
MGEWCVTLGECVGESLGGKVVGEAGLVLVVVLDFDHGRCVYGGARGEEQRVKRERLKRVKSEEEECQDEEEEKK